MLSRYKFLYGKSYENSNVYTFIDENKNKLIISEKVGKFIQGEISQYLLFEYTHDNKSVREYIGRDSEQYKEMTNIRPIIENFGGITSQCTGCNTIVLKEQLTNAKGDKCEYCDKYVCKKCKRFFPKIELDENRLCERCRNEI